jgi:hypothetical protein
MISPSLQAALAKVSRQAVLIWIAMMAALPIYGAVTWFAASMRRVTPALLTG